MKQKIISHLNKKNLYHLCNTVLFSLLALFLFHKFFGIKVLTSFHIFIVLYATVFFCGFRFFEFRGKVFWGISMCVITLLLFSFSGFYKIKHLLSSYFHWLNSSGEWSLEALPLFQSFNLFALVAVAFFIQILLEKYFFLKLCFGTGILLFLFFCLFTKKEILHSATVLAIFYIVLVYVEWTLTVKGSTPNADRRLSLLFLLPFLTAYLLLMLLLPSPEAPYQWTWAKTLFQKATDTFLSLTQSIGNLYGTEDFSISFVGFSEEGGFSGSLEESNREVMTISPDSYLKSNIYLVGKVFDTFDGKEWLETNSTSQNDREIDALETIYAVNRYDSASPKDYLLLTSLEVRYRYFYSQYLFAPLKSTKIENEGGSLSLINQGYNLLFPKRKGYGTEYCIKYQQMNLNHPAFYQMIEAQQNYPYGVSSALGNENRKLLSKLQDNYLNRSSKSTLLTEEDFIQHSKQIHELYGQPTVLSADVQSLLAETTKDAANDIEKLEAIELLLTSMHYTTTPGEIPENADFLEFFLLEKKEGYCSYFATAFVLLARAEGIPARYVQGFCVPAASTEKTGISVTSNMAHAWPEAYIDGVGWIPFEPTPDYGEVRYTPWKITNTIKNNNSSASSFVPPISPSEEEQITEETNTFFSHKADAKFRLLLLFSLLFSLFLIVCFLLLDNWKNKRNYKKMSYAQKLNSDIKKNMNILSLTGFCLNAGETLSEFRQRAIDITPMLPLSFLSIYEEVLYGNREITNSLLEEVRAARKPLLTALKIQKGKMYVFSLIKLYFYQDKTK